MKLGLKIFFAGAIAFVVAIACLVFAIVTLTGAAAATPEFRVPGKFKSTTDEAGIYYIWDSNQTSFDGKIVKRPESLPDGYEVTVFEGEEELPFTFDRSMNFSVGSHVMKSVGYVDAPANTELTVQIEGFEEPFRVASFARSSFGDLVFKTVFPFFAAVAGGALGGLIMIVGLIVWLIERTQRDSAGTN